MAGQKSYTPYELAELERISRAMLYKMWKQGKGPRFYCIGNRRRISEEARIEWRRKLEACGSGKAANDLNAWLES
jgi:hypothetical protein